MRVKALVVLAIGSCFIAANAPAARAQECRRAVVFTVPGVTWEQVAREEPPNLLAVAERGAVGSVAVRTNSARTTYASGFATIGAGTRIDVPSGAAQPVDPQGHGAAPVRVAGIEAINELAAEQGYSLARSGAFGEAVADATARGVAAVGTGDGDAETPPPVPLASHRHVLLAAMNTDGVVPIAATGSRLLQPADDAPFGVRTDPEAFSRTVSEILAEPCAVAVIDQGDLLRADRASSVAVDADDLRSERADALLAADAALGEIVDLLDESRDLLLVVSPVSPQWEDAVHFGIAAAVGPGFEPGSELSSPSTRRGGMVTLPDVAPTVLEHLGIERPSSMLGRSWFSEPASGATQRVADAVELDRETVFIDGIRTPVSTAFVLFQLLVYAAAVWVVARGFGDGSRRTIVQTPLQSAALFLAAFPLSTYLAGVVDGHEMGWFMYSALLVAVTAIVVIGVNIVLDGPLTRLLFIAAATFSVIVVDLLIGAPLQLNTVFSYSPIVAGRFAGIGNIGFAILAATSLLTGALIVHRWGATRRSLALVAALFALTVVVDGAPQFGSDVGGAIALVPGLGIAWLLIAGRKPNLRSAVIAAVAGLVVLGVFLAADLARPEASQTHLARLFEDVRSGGGQVFRDAIVRKIRTNLRVLGSTIWTFVVPPALGLLAWLLLRPRWQWLSQTYPRVRAGLVAGLIMAVLGYAVNDSGIVIPAMMFSYLVPVAVAPLAEPLSRERTERAE